MGKIADFLYGPTKPESVAPVSKSRAQFATAFGDDPSSLGVLWGMFGGVGAVSRADCMSVPAIKAARDKFANLGTLPLQAFNAAGQKVDRALLVQPEARMGLVRSTTLQQSIDDLFFYSECLWLYRDSDYNGFPSSVERIPHAEWSVDSKNGLKIRGESVDPGRVIVFKSGNEPMTKVGAPTVRVMKALERSSSKYIERPEMTEYFSTNDGTQPDDTEVSDFLADWQSARYAGTTGFIPSNLDRHEVKRMTAEELQLSAAREFSIAEVARLTGLSPHYLGLNITTRVYSNIQDEKRDFIEGPASVYIHAIEERLSLDDVVPHGTYTKFNLNGYLRANTLERYQTYAIALDKGFLTVDEVRELEDRGPIDG